MLTDFVLGLLSSPCFVGCGVQFRFGPLWISTPLVEFPSVHAGSVLLLCLGLGKLPSRYLEELCVLWAVDFHIRRLSFPWLCWEFYSLSTMGCGLFPSFAL